SKAKAFVNGILAFKVEVFQKAKTEVALKPHDFPLDIAKEMSRKRLCVYFIGRCGLRDGAGDEDNGMRDCGLH
ncbi:hypothetical protein, partial [Sutterella wadsworthensis]|uniref:hypothetical protein n=1 Tax=Sutterella wadsworthensis TaxID=40545 RepID=UPI00402A6416